MTLVAGLPSPSPSPALTPPPGVTPNFVNPDSLWEENLTAQVVCLSLAGITFFLRCYARLGLNRRLRQWTVEDWMVCWSFIGLVVYSALIIVIMKNKGGIHQWNLTVPEVRKILYYFWIESVIYGPIIYFTKVSILLMFVRIFCPRRWSFMWWMIWSFIVISGMFYTAITIVKIWQCHPQERIWDHNVNGSCINVAMLLSASGFFNTISDAVILLIPIKSVWNLKMSIQKKIGACLVLTLGAVAPVFSVIGFVVRVRTASSKDASYNHPLILLWATAEVTTGVVCACLPAIPTIYRAKFRSKMDIRHGTKSYPRTLGDSCDSSDKNSVHRSVDCDLEHNSARSKKDSVERQLNGAVYYHGARLFAEVEGGVCLKRSNEHASHLNSNSQCDRKGILKTVEIQQSDLY